MATYRVTWVIDLEADSDTEAAQRALDIQRNPESTATVFDVERHAVPGGCPEVTTVDMG